MCFLSCGQACVSWWNTTKKIPNLHTETLGKVWVMLDYTYPCEAHSWVDKQSTDSGRDRTSRCWTGGTPHCAPPPQRWSPAWPPPQSWCACPPWELPFPRHLCSGRSAQRWNKGQIDTTIQNIQIVPTVFCIMFWMCGYLPQATQNRYCHPHLHLHSLVIS